MRYKLTVVLLVVIFLSGFCILAYPTVSNFINTKGQEKAIDSYSDEVKSLDSAEGEEALNAAIEYNRRLAEKSQSFSLTADELTEYNSLLNISGKGIMGYIEIPSIKCSLAIYHGTSDESLKKGVGHIEGTSLPVGGESTHCVLSGHRGLPSAKLFSNLNEVEIGDRFTISVLGKKLTYEVDQILVVLPEKTDDLLIVEGEDLCTLVTCTPYGINSHRLLVRGKRVEE